MSVFYTASPAGAAIGVAAAGVLAAQFGWRSACLMVGLPGLVAAVLMLRQREPVRGQMDTNPSRTVRRSLGGTLAILARNRPFVLFALAYGGMVFTQNAVEYWLPSVLNRDKAIPLAISSAWYGAVGLVAGIGGPIAGALIADARKRRDPNAYAHVAAWMALLLTVPVFGIAVSAAKVPLFTSVFGEAFLGNAAVGIIMTLIVGAAAPEMRSTATAIALTACHAVGDIPSIWLVGVLSTALQRRAANGAMWASLRSLGLTPDQHLVVALATVVIPGAIATAVLFIVAARASQPSRKIPQPAMLPIASESG
jgi:predicted MFS family arabinose efflux permease